MIYNMRGDAYHAGPVMLSDVYTSAVGSAKDGVAASQRALYEAYNSLNSSKADTYGWSESNPDLNVSLITDVLSGANKSQAALQSHNGTNGWRLLMGHAGNIDLYKTTDGGTNWSYDRGIFLKRADVYSNAVSVGNATEVSFALPSGYHFSFGVVLAYAWPQETWNNGAVVTIVQDKTILANTGSVVLTTNQAQRYGITLCLLYI